MPYHIGEKGSNGCSGYPVLSDKGHVAGCHPTEANAQEQLAALYANVADASKGEASIETSSTSENPSSSINPAVGMKKPQYGYSYGRTVGGGIHDKRVVEIWTVKADAPLPENPIMPTNTYQGCDCKTCKQLNVNCDNCPVCNNGAIDSQTEMTMPDTSVGKSDCCSKDINKQAPCWDGYVQRGMKPGENGKPVPNCVPAAKADNFFEDDDTVEYYTDTVAKADGYSPPAGARSAARRAIKFKEDGKANGAGTSVGWTRAGQLARGESLSLSTVKRMYSYFSRHEVDKKGKDWGNSANPSNGYIMWLAWGGDAGFSWSRSIVNREKDKALFSDFGKDYTKNTTERHSI
jgi:hypothetical protein